MILPAEDLTHVLKNMDSWDKLRRKRLFLTGASGFVGTWLTQTFDCANRSLELEAELNPVPRNSLPSGHFDFGIHAAKSADFSADVSITKRILDFTAERGVSRFLFISSGAVYGNVPAGVTAIAEDFTGAPYSNDAASGYAQAKRAGEFLCAEYAQRFGFAAMIARLFTFSGPMLPLNTNFAFGNFIRDAIAGGPLLVQGDGTALRSYLYAADLAVWLWKILLNGENSRPYNVGSPNPISISELASTVVAQTKPGTEVVVMGAEGQSVYVPCVQRAASELNLRQLISLDEGIRRTYVWNVRNETRDAHYSHKGGYQNGLHQPA